MEKQAYALVKDLGHFRDYFWNARVIAYVPHPMVKDILVQKECSGQSGLYQNQAYQTDQGPRTSEDDGREQFGCDT
jgi:hypothetical protein